MSANISLASEWLETILWRARRHAPAPSYPHRYWSMVDRVTQPWSTTRGPSAWDFLYRNNSFFQLSLEILQKGP
jgi:hypothetical protein